MPISGNGWELFVNRLGLHLSGAKSRTYGSYQVYHDGTQVEGLAGYICECIGPGTNTVSGSARRVQQGRYPLWTQFGNYRSTGYSEDTETAGQPPMPAIRLEGTGNRDGILIHPGHPPTLFLSSIGCLNPTHKLSPTDVMNFWDSRTRVIALVDDLRQFAPDAFQHEVLTRIPNAWAVIDGEPMNVLTVPDPPLSAVAAHAAEPDSLPVSRSAAVQCAQWLLDNFATQFRGAVQGKPYQVKHLFAIVCQETAYKWIKWIGKEDAKTIVARSVFDASGDYPGTTRSVFPVDTAAFKARYGDAFTDMLIEEANVTRRMQGWSDQQWVYKGYGLFQYDLQKVDTDEAFFREKQWYSFDTCLAKCVSELDEKLKAKNGDLWKAIAAYNGSGAAAIRYAANVQTFTDYCAEVTGEK